MLISLTPLSESAIDRMALEKWPDMGSLLDSPIWKIARGDSMGLPRFVEWMLGATPNSQEWSALLYDSIVAYQAFGSLAHFGHQEGAKVLVALALTEHPVCRGYFLGSSCGTIGQVERDGAIHLVPRGSSKNGFLVRIPFPICRRICALLNQSR